MSLLHRFRRKCWANSYFSLTQLPKKDHFLEIQINPILRGLFRPRKRGGGWQNCHPYTNCCSTGPIVFKLGQNVKLSKCFKFLEKKSKFLMTSSLFFGKNIWNFFFTFFFFFLEMIFKHKTIFFFFFF